MPFYTAAGTEFMEMFVGIGASRVRDMFQRARANAPCILFIDEFDGLGKQRSFSAMGNDGEKSYSWHTENTCLLPAKADCCVVIAFADGHYLHAVYPQSSGYVCKANKLLFLLS